MPVKSRQQYKFMKSIEEKNIKVPGLSPEKAAEYTRGMTKSRWKNLKNLVGQKKK